MRKRGINSKAQITLFIIIGILILLSAFVIFFFREQLFKGIEEVEAPDIGEEPAVFKPVRLFTEDCIFETSKEALLILGQQGGYIDPSRVGYYSYTDAVEADGVKLSDSSGLNIPYWNYNSMENDGNNLNFMSLRPGLYNGNYAIKMQIQDYIDNNLEECLDDYKIFKKLGLVIETENVPETRVSITDGKISILVDYPVTAESDDSVHSASQFYSELDVDIKGLYELATVITNTERESGFLERNTLNLIEVFSGADKKKLPPMTYSDMGYNEIITWNTVSVKESFEELLSAYVPMLRLYGSSDFVRYEFEESENKEIIQRVYDDMILNLQEDYPNYEAKFDYLLWPLYFSINNGQSIIQPEQGAVSLKIFNFAMQRYKSVYSISYPAIITLRDVEAFDGEGYDFVFALESNIRNNKPIVPSAPLEEERVTLSDIAFSGAESGFQKNLIGNENQRNSGNITITAYDRYSSDTLEGISVSYSLEGKKIYLGNTDKEGRLVTKLPVALGGFLVFESDDHLRKFIQFNTYLEQEDSVDAELDKLYRINASANKLDMFYCDDVCYTGNSLGLENDKKGWKVNRNPKEFQEDEQLVVVLEHMDSDFSSVLSVTGDERQEMLLAPGRYNASLSYVKDEIIAVPDQEIEGQVIPGTVMDQSIPVTVNPGNIDISADDLFKNDEIIFFTLAPVISAIPEEKINYRMLSNISSEANDYIKENKKDVMPAYD